MLNGIRNLTGNPYLRNQLTLAFTGPRLGIAFLLICGGLTAIHLVAFAAAASRGMPESSPATAGLLFAHFLALLVLLIVLLPIKAAGSFEGPRLSGVFDQIVATGVNPRLFTLGAWVSGLLYAVLILIVSLPFAACMYWLGGVPLGPIVLDYGLLLLYANVILAISLATSTLVREWAAVPGTIAVLTACILFAVVPDRDTLSGTPEFFAELTPARLLLIQSFPPGSLPSARIDYAADPVFLFWAIPRDLFRILSWALVGALALLVVAVGPGHWFRPGYNIFGTVATSSRGRFGGLMKRLRGGLVRRIELAFFYENTKRWTRRWGPAIRAGLVLLPVFFIWGFLIGSIYLGHPYPGRVSFWRDLPFLTLVIVSAGTTMVWVLLMCEGRRSRSVPMQLGGRALPRELFVSGGFALLCTCWALLMWVTREQLLANLVAQTPPTRNPNGLGINMFDWSRYGATTPWTAPQIADYASASKNFLITILAAMINTFLLSRLVNRVTPVLARSLTVILFWVIAGVPVIVAVLIGNQILPTSLIPVVYLSPTYVAADLLMGTDTSEATRLAQHLIAQGILGLTLLAPLLLTTLWRRRGRRRLTPATVAAALVTLGTMIAGLPAQERSLATRGPVVLEHVARGFDGATFQHGVDFFTVVVSNPNEHAVQGEYWIEGGHDAIRRQPIYLSPKSSKTLRVNRVTNRWWRTRNAAQFVVRIGDQRVASEEIDLFIRGDRNSGNANDHQYLFVGEAIDLPSQLLRQLMSDNAQNAISCQPRNLPVEATSYCGVEVVWLTTEGLQGMVAPQREALYQFVLLGGTLIFTGGLPADGIARTGVWEDLLATTSSRESKLGDMQLRHVALIEGRDLLFAPTIGASQPVLNIRPVGVGQVGHCAFLPHRSRTPAPLAESPEFWIRFAAAMPPSRYPHSITSYAFTPLFADWTSMGYLGVYLGLYSVIVAGALFFSGRRRSTQRMPLGWMSLSLGFGAGIPLLVAVIRDQPSTAGYFEYTWFGPRSTHGVVYGDLRLRSGGKQQHGIELHDPAVFATQAEEYGPAAQGMQLTVHPDAERRSSRIGLSMPAWSRTRVALGAPRRRDRPLQAQAVQAGKTAIEVSGTIPLELRGLPVWAVWRDTAGVVSVPLQHDAAGRFMASIKQAKPAGRSSRVQRRGWQLPGHGLQLFAGQRPAPAAMIVFAIDTPRHEPGIGITSEHLEFETPLPQRRTIRNYTDPYEYLPKLVRDGRQRALRVRRSVIFELTIEQR